MFDVIIKQKRTRSLLRRHPWIFSGAIKTVSGTPKSGETVRVCSEKGEFLGWGFWSPESQIRVRIWSFNEAAVIDRNFFRYRIQSACNMRRALGLLSSGNGCRLIHGEADGVAGLIVDYYDSWIVCQFLSAGAEYQKEQIVAALVEELQPKGIFERSDTSARAKEGLLPISGTIYGEEPPEKIVIRENDVKFLVDVRNGHKTGFYLDQKDNRLAVAAAVKDKEVLNCFSYTGGFSLWALKGGAKHVTSVDASQVALDTAVEQMQLNNFAPESYEMTCADVFAQLRKYRDQAKAFDVIILDPPKFAETKGQVNKASRAYKDINLLAFKLLKPGGRLFTYSCSGAIDNALFQKIVADAAIDAKRNAKITRHLFQGADHPINLNFPEGSYLKGLELFVD